MQRRPLRPRAGLLLALVFSGFVACAGELGDGPAAPTPTPEVPKAKPFEPPAPTMRRLLARHYRNSIGDLLGPTAKAAAVPPADQPLNGFDLVGAAQLNVGDLAVVEYEKSARLVARAAVEAYEKLDDYLACVPTDAEDAACLESFLRNFGSLAFRRPITDVEAKELTQIGLAAGKVYSSFDSALEYGIATILQSPSFVYQVEVGEPVPEAPSFRRLTPRELATRMSFFLNDTTPDRELLDLADAGGLESPEDARAAAKVLVARPAAEGAVSALYDEILGLRRLATLTKSNELYPEFTPTLAASMREETLRLLADVVWKKNSDFTEFFSSDHTFVNAELAALYGVSQPPAGEWQEVSFPADQPRAGFFGQASFLSTQAHIELTSPTLRGKFIRERLLCQSINPPPNNVTTEFPDNANLKTMRERLAYHQENPSCAGCHLLTDPLGLSFENFDAIGRHRLTENGVTIDPSGNFDKQGSFADGAELAQLIAGDPAFTECLVRNVLRASLGHLETEGEEGAIEELSGEFTNGGRRLRGFLIHLVGSAAFRYVGVEK